MEMNETLETSVVFKEVTDIPRRKGYYLQVLEKFLNQDHDLVEVLIENKPYHAVYSGLQHASSLHPEYREKIKIYKRKPRVFLEKIQSCT